MSSANLHPLTGVISNTGVLLWACTAGIALLAGGLLLKRPDKRRAAFFLCLAAATGFAAVDDLFLLHSEYLVRATEQVKTVTGLLYAGGFIALGVYFRRQLSETAWELLILATLAFSLSLVLDQIEMQLEHLMGQWQIFLEDGAKLAGIFAWFGYVFFSALIMIRRELESTG